MNILDLMQQRGPVKRTSARDGGEWHSSCLKCGGEDRFMFWPARGNFHCRGCQWKGDAITILREIDGLTFREAAALVGKELPETDRARQARERAMKERILTEYSQWYHVQLKTWTDQFQEITEEIDMAQIMYRLTVQMPHWFLEEARDYWENCLATLYHELSSVEHTCDILTYSYYERERFEWWQTVYKINTK